MKYRTLGASDLRVSELCLGSMTWGSQNTAEQGHAQIDRALDAGINFIDTAEMYPVNPVRAETVGDTERVIGDWFEKTGRRDDVILATKAGGDSKAIRNGDGYGPDNIETLIDASLGRLKTDVIDLYQLHWPMRGSFHFRQNWGWAAKGEREAVLDHIRGTLAGLERARKAGKIRYLGLSNDSAWGTMQWLRLAEETGGPRPVSVQNEYSLLCRLYDTDMAEVTHFEDVALLAYSPMAAGMLSGKYGPNDTPEGSRRSFAPNLGGRVTDRVWPAIEAYRALAQRYQMDPAQMALAWTLTRPFMGASIFGATTIQQLNLAIAAADLHLPPELLNDIDTVHKSHPMPY